MRRRLVAALCFAALALTSALAGGQESTESVRQLLQRAREKASNGQHMETLKLLTRARMLAPNSEEVLSDFAENSLAIDDPVAAMVALEALSRMHPTVARYPYLLGVARLQLGAMELSVEALRKSLELAPDEILTMIGLGISYNAQKKYAEAKEILVQSLELDPEKKEALAALAEAEEGLGELEAAEYHAARVLKVDSGHAGANFVLGRVRMAQGRFEEARDFFEATISTNPDGSKAYYQLSLAYARLNEPELSKQYRELYQEAKEREEEFIVQMRTRAGMGVGGMKL
jgi:tetratricopeptide (TPR) repeat protein